MKKSAGASRTIARAGTSATSRKAKTASPATQKPKGAVTRSASSKRGTNVGRPGSIAGKSSTVIQASQKRASAGGPKQVSTARRGQSVRGREVGGTPWAELRHTLTATFESAYAERKGQARGAAMRGPNRIIGEMDKYVTAIIRQTNARQTQVQKLTEELAGLREQQKQWQSSNQGQGQGQGQSTQTGNGLTGERRIERTAPDQIAGVPQGTALENSHQQQHGNAMQDAGGAPPSDFGTGHTDQSATRRQRSRTSHPASAD